MSESEVENPNSPPVQLRKAADRIEFAGDHLQLDDEYADLSGRDDVAEMCREMARITRRIALLAEAAAMDDDAVEGGDGP
ncbi:hypothetical protein [Halorarum salinum]|uniref:Uncharacterized protein n=1 Tax=Halorarum salinum TaxID=2743089 RepID=A0A7D5LCX7_9EURY|nr:hypothetical protein [Halobaculum salinum]QLG63049.1 hypothetical protein HUG12_15440 [Halobaculum salinum]